MAIYYDGSNFDFYMMPQLLFKSDEYKELSVNAKVIYMVCLQRLSLSKQSGWIDNQGRYFIVMTVKNVMDILNCSNKSALRVLDELDDVHGIGLIERRRQGQGKPNKVYVRDFRYR